LHRVRNLGLLVIVVLNLFGGRLGLVSRLVRSVESKATLVSFRPQVQSCDGRAVSIRFLGFLVEDVA
jgi:hypothetical protein